MLLLGLSLVFFGRGTLPGVAHGRVHGTCAASLGGAVYLPEVGRFMLVSLTSGFQDPGQSDAPTLASTLHPPSPSGEVSGQSHMSHYSLGTGAKSSQQALMRPKGH